MTSTKATTSEEIFYEGGPARGDLIFNLLIGFTIIFLPFTIGAIVRSLWLRFRITSRRVSVTGGWMGRDRTQVVYSQIKDVRSIPRGLGGWGDMVLILKDDAKLEMRSVPRFRETEAFILEHIGNRPAKGTSADVKGFAV